MLQAFLALPLLNILPFVLKRWLTVPQTSFQHLQCSLPNLCSFVDCDTMALSTLGYRKSRVAMSVLLPFELRKWQVQIVASNLSVSLNNQVRAREHCLLCFFLWKDWRDRSVARMRVSAVTWRQIFSLHNNFFHFQIDTACRRTPLQASKRHAVLGSKHCLFLLLLFCDYLLLLLFFQTCSYFNHEVTTFTFEMSVLLAKGFSFERTTYLFWFKRPVLGLRF